MTLKEARMTGCHLLKEAGDLAMRVFLAEVNGTGSKKARSLELVPTSAQVSVTWGRLAKQELEIHMNPAGVLDSIKLEGLDLLDSFGFARRSISLL